MNDVINNSQFVKHEEISPKELLRFAKCILIGIVLLFIGGCFTELIWTGNMVFEVCKNLLPTFAGIIIGYYFGKN